MRNNIPLGSFHRSFEILPFKQKLKMSLGTLVIPFLSLFLVVKTMSVKSAPPKNWETPS
jgi:hypothetical protein